MPYKDPEQKRAWERRNAERINARKAAVRRQRYAEWPEYREGVLALNKHVTKAARQAHQAVRTAIKRGVLVRPEACARCGAGGRIEAAHRDYSRPLDVEWLCVSCHRREDKANPKGGYVPPDRRTA